MTPALLSTLLLGAPLCGPIDLDAALALALERSDEVAIKQADVVSAQADLALARAVRFVPEANMTVSFGPSPAAHGTVTDVKFGSSRSLRDLSLFGRVEVDALQPLYTWGRLDAARDAATAGVRGREDLVQDTQSQVQLRVHQLYWGVALANRLLIIAADVEKAAPGAAAMATGATAAPGESARCKAWNTNWCTLLESRKRTSVFAGWTFTSTPRGSSSRNSTYAGWRSPCSSSA